MKLVFWLTAILLLTNSTAQAQAKAKKANSKQSLRSKTVAATKSVSNKVNNAPNRVTLATTASHTAKATTNTLSVLKNTYSISDPILTTLKARANDANIRFNKSGIVGMPKSAYGFANGHIVLRTTGAVTFGTQTGSGAVGTGTSLATFGSVGAPMNVNGKSPYAGINMWGNAMNMEITRRILLRD